MNHLADRTLKEIALLRGRTHTKGYNGGLPFEPDPVSLQDIPVTLDWRLYGNVFFF